MVDTMEKNGTGLAVTVPCGKCLYCLRKRQKQWAFRLQEHMKDVSSAIFLTLTYETPPLSKNGHPTLDPKALQNFIKRLRKNSNSKNLKYYAVGEYGTRYLRPHYHIILFNLSQAYIQKPTLIADVWSSGSSNSVTHGFIDIGTVTTASIMYVAGYVISGAWRPQVDENTGLISEIIDNQEVYYDDRVPHFSRMSKGLGLRHLKPQTIEYYVQNNLNVVTLPGGQLLQLPRYYQRKIKSYMYALGREREHYEYLKTVNQEAELYRNMQFDKWLENPHKQLSIVKDKVRKHEKVKLERNKKF